MKQIVSPMAGAVWKITVALGDEVDFGDIVIILESMKMEIAVESEHHGIIEEILVKEGEVVDQDTPLVRLR